MSRVSLTSCRVCGPCIRRSSLHPLATTTQAFDAYSTGLCDTPTGHVLLPTLFKLGGSALFIKGPNFESCAPHSPAETMTVPIFAGRDVTASPSPMGISTNGVTPNGFQRSSTSSSILESEPESVRSTTSNAGSIHTSFIPLSRTSSISSIVSFASGEVEVVTEEGVRHAQVRLSAK